MSSSSWETAKPWGGDVAFWLEGQFELLDAKRASDADLGEVRWTDDDQPYWVPKGLDPGDGRGAGR